ncbi:DNA polymerase [Paraburkholderia sp. BL10I2N1]|uniref:DNA polymerase n=1 Tax=Paraburkholderia sp. BL10I2N1 TaxID=1938796 RepID=UPI00105E57F7|nr:DNA polymerase [Paraburkholderia sp. BL10I2N1]TDN70474.1 DNA polymerase [Paraburkholderia sp. BL10I2N1]
MDLVTVDWETYYDRQFSLSKLTTEAYVRDPRFEEIGFAWQINDGEQYWVTGGYDEIHRAVKDLKLEKRAVLCHHTAFDGLILSQRHGVVASQYLDTLSIARSVFGANGGCSLAALARRFMLEDKGDELLGALGKHRADFTPHQLFRYGEYCKKDVRITHALLQILRQFSTPQELYVIDLMLRMYVDPVLELDPAVLSAHLQSVKEKKAALLKLVEETAGKDALMSNDRFAGLLVELGVVPPMKKSEAKSRTAGHDVFTYAFSKTDEGFKALLEHDDPRVQALVSARVGVKTTIEETRTEAFIGIAMRGALPVPLSYYAAHTGRAGGWDKINMQNLPRKGALRRAIRAPKGHKVVACDSSQIEARVVAWLAGQTDLVEAFARGADIYSEFAGDVYGYPVDRKATAFHPDTGEEYTPHDEEGRVGKTSILGLGFGMGKDKFDASLKKAGVRKGLAFSERVVDLYRTKYAMIRKLWKSAQTALESVCNGYVAEIGVGIRLRWDQDGIHLPNGMLVRYKNLRRTEDGDYVYDGRNGATKIYGAKIVENVVQALARIIVFNQMCMIDQKLKPLDRTDGRYKVVLTVHDEVVGICPDHFAPALREMMVTAMRVIPRWATGLPITCEAAGGESYGDCK